MDIVPVHPVLPSDYRPIPFERLPDGAYRNPATGALYRISSITGDLMEQPVNTAFRRTATVEMQ